MYVEAKLDIWSRLHGNPEFLLKSINFKSFAEPLNPPENNAPDPLVGSDMIMGPSS